MSLVGPRSGVSAGRRIRTDYFHLTLTLFISILAFPIVFILDYAFTAIDEAVRPFWMMATGFALLVSISVLAYSTSRMTDWLYFGMTAFAFSSIIDLIITLEFIGVIENFMSEYLKIGEPYLFSSWGSAICIFDGTGFYIMYNLIVYLLSNGKSWRSVGLYWAAGILNSMLVLMIGIFIGHHPPTFCTFLNVPYIMLPIIVLFRIFGNEARPAWNASVGKNVNVDALLILGFGFSIWVTIARTLTALGSGLWIVTATVSAETALHLQGPAPFALLQALVLFFYALPAQITSLSYLFKREKPRFLWELAVAQAGVILQAQFSYIWYSLDRGTPAPYRVDWASKQFWFVNLTILIVPHLFLLRLYSHRKSSGAGKRAEKRN